MSRIGGFGEQDAIRIGQAVRVIEKGALEHPFYRRQGPVNSGNDVATFVYKIASGTEDVLCPDPTGIGGFTNAGNMRRLNDDLTLETDTTLINVDLLNGFVIPFTSYPNPGDIPPHWGTVEAKNFNGTWYATSGGTTAFWGEYDLGGGEVTPSVGNGNALACADHCAEDIPDEADVRVVLDADGPGIERVCCE